tara:strand:- start:491 stop:1291 length:801 start_codon:yes stop_codon:yes gene_type:complete
MLGLGTTLSGGAALPAAFTAASISGLDLWYDFSTLTGSNGDAVSSFANAGDGGSNYDLSQGTGSVQPNLDTSELSLNSLDFDNDKFQLANAYLTTDQTFSIFIVYEVDATGDVDTFIAGSTTGANQFGVYNHKNVTTRFNADVTGSLNNVEYIRTDQTTQDAGYGGDATTITAYTLTANPEILVLTRAADEEIKIFNKAGDLIGLSTSTTNNHANTNFQIEYIGAQSNTASPNNGVIGEIGVYNKTLSADEVSSLITHLADKWSIS